MFPFGTSLGTNLGMKLFLVTWVKGFWGCVLESAISKHKKCVGECMMDYAKISNVGNREHNEDCVEGMIRKFNDDECGCFVLADGLGGHGRGEVASQLIVGIAMDLFECSNDTEGILQRILSEGQKELMDMQKRERAYYELKTTAVSLFISGEKIYWAHIGDSRLYYFKNKKMVLRTKDHSVPQMLATSGEIKEKAIRKHPDRNKLLRVMGIEWNEPRYTVSDMIANEGKQAFLLCSDGFWEFITEKQMEKCLKKADSAEEWLKLMNAIVQKNGCKEDMDNNTALVVML